MIDLSPLKNLETLILDISQLETDLDLTSLASATWTSNVEERQLRLVGPFSHSILKLETPSSLAFHRLQLDSLMQKQLANITTSFPLVHDYRMGRLIDDVQALRAADLPQSGSISKLQIKGTLQYVDLFSFVRAFNTSDLESLTGEVVIQSFEIPLFCKFDIYAQPLSCCNEPKFIEASHCPPVAPLSCPQSDVVISVLQICDGRADCPDAYDELHCSATLAMDPVTVKQFEEQIRSNISTQLAYGFDCMQRLALTVRSGQWEAISLSDDSTCAGLYGVLRGWDALEGLFRLSVMR